MSADGSVVTRPLTVWLIGDGKPGHENQSLGLAEAMARLQPCGIHRISIARPGGLLGRLRQAFRVARSLPHPDVILAAGHATHLPLLGLSFWYRAKSVVLMRPSFPVCCFDLCLAPEHDFSGEPRRRNLRLTRGALNRVRAGSGDARGKLVLLGGPSKTHAWDSSGMLQMLVGICTGEGWELTDSRRTPEGFVEQVRKALPQVKVYPHQETGAGWLPAKLENAREVWVTEDSVSMVYEALTSGARVGLLPVPRLRVRSRVLNGLERLVEDACLTPYDDARGLDELPLPASGPLREADRCAAMVCGLLNAGEVVK